MTWLRGASDGLSRTPLHYSAKEGQLESIRLLLRYGADPNARDGDGYTPVHYVCQIHNPPDDIQERVHQCLLSLLEFGGQYKARTNSGHTPLDLARKHRNRVCKNELLRQGMSRTKSRGSECFYSVYTLIEVHLCSLLVLCRHLVSDLIHRQLLEPVNRLWIPESLKRCRTSAQMCMHVHAHTHMYARTHHRLWRDTLTICNSWSQVLAV